MPAVWRQKLGRFILNKAHARYKKKMKPLTEDLRHIQQVRRMERPGASERLGRSMRVQNQTEFWTGVQAREALNPNYVPQQYRASHRAHQKLKQRFERMKRVAGAVAGKSFVKAKPKRK